MKKTNKKGFTLIELLAVIIILGILMIIAIPSVTRYIQNSRKSAYVDDASQYIKAVQTKVNEAKELSFFDTTTFYLVPTGHQEDRSCVGLESGGNSPFSDEWLYAYVGVTYSGSGYDYYWISRDGANQGIKLTKAADLTSDDAGKGTDLVTSGFGGTSDHIAELETLYTASTATATTYTDSCPTGETCTAIPSALKTAIKNATGSEIYTTVLVAGTSSNKCVD